MGEAFELPPLSKPKYIDGKKLVKKARWQLKIGTAMPVPRNVIIEYIAEYLKLSNTVSYSHTHLAAMADIEIIVDDGNRISHFYNPILKKLFVNVDPTLEHEDLVGLSQIIEDHLAG